jgi:hypothetical protein
VRISAAATGYAARLSAQIEYPGYTGQKTLSNKAPMTTVDQR